jgi:two-component system phosphate regulon sensor histidine kinase PhoR
MKFRQKLLLFGLAVAALTALAVFLAGGAILRASVSDRVTDRLKREARVLADALARDPHCLTERTPAPTGEAAAGSAQGASGGSAPGTEAADSASAGSAQGAEAACDALADQTGAILGLRVTIVANDGRVLGDSSLDADEIAHIENHATRPEIAAAHRDGLGESSRHSDTVHDQLYYVACRVQRAGRTVGFARLASPVSESQRSSFGYRELLAAACFLVLLLVALVGWAAARRFSAPIEAMSRTADAIAAGRRDLEVEYASDDEIGRLGAAVNRMTRAMGRQIHALSSEKRLRDTIFAGMQEGVLVLDTERRILLANDALRWILGLGARDPAGRRLIEIVRDRDVLAGFDAALLRGEPFREVIRIGTASERSFEINVVPLTDSGGAQVGAIGILFDVTRLTALENVRREFVADASHELRTPLTSIKAFVETLLSGGLEDAANNRRFLEIIKKHADRMEAILDDLTDLSLIETGAIALEMERLDLAPIAQELVDGMKPRAERYGVTVASQVPPATLVFADRRRLDQILLNLLENAVKFSGTGATVTIRAEAAVPGGGIRVIVEDTGIGIAPVALEKIFHRFYRGEGARFREKGGTGLGLAIVKHLMRAHGGTVRAESEPGQGSRFILEFPEAVQAPGPAAASRS